MDRLDKKTYYYSADVYRAAKGDGYTAITTRKVKFSGTIEDYVFLEGTTPNLAAEGLRINIGKSLGREAFPIEVRHRPDQYICVICRPPVIFSDKNEARRHHTEKHPDPSTPAPNPSGGFYGPYGVKVP